MFVASIYTFNCYLINLHLFEQRINITIIMIRIYRLIWKKMQSALIRYFLNTLMINTYIPLISKFGVPTLSIT